MNDDWPEGVPKDAEPGFMHPAKCWRWTRGNDKYICILISGRNYSDAADRYTYHKNAYYHREDGPAIIESPYKLYYLNGTEYTHKEYLRLLVLKAFW